MTTLPAMTVEYSGTSSHFEHTVMPEHSFNHRTPTNKRASLLFRGDTAAYLRLKATLLDEYNKE